MDRTILQCRNPAYVEAVVMELLRTFDVITMRERPIDFMDIFFVGHNFHKVLIETMAKRIADRGGISNIKEVAAGTFAIAMRNERDLSTANTDLN